jgi:hypothetical protein
MENDVVVGLIDMMVVGVPVRAFEVHFHMSSPKSSYPIEVVHTKNQDRCFGCAARLEPQPVPADRLSSSACESAVAATDSTVVFH